MSFGPFADRKRHKGTPNTYLSDAPLTIAWFGLCAESPFQPKDKVLRALSGPFFNISKCIGLGSIPAPRVYYKSGDCSIRSPQQRKLNSRQTLSSFGWEVWLRGD